MQGRRSASHLEILSLALIVTAFAFVLYATSILIVDHSRKDVYFGSDSSEYSSNVKKDGTRAERNKRPLFGLLVTPFYRLLEKMGLPNHRIVALLFGGLGALAVGLMFFALQRLFCQPVLAAIIAVCYALAFGNVVMFGIPEAYSLSVLFVVSLIVLIIKSIEEPLSRHWKIGLLGGVTGLTNPIAMFPLVAYGLLMLGTRPLISAFRTVAIVALMAVAIYWLPSLVGYTTGIEWKLHYFHRRRATAYNLADWYLILSMVVDFFVFAVVSPYKTVLQNYSASDIRGYLESATRLAGFALWIGVFGYALVTTFRRRNRESLIAASLLCSLLPLIVFYVYLGPKEGMIYTPFSLVVLFLIVGVAARTSKGAAAVLLTLMILLAAINVLPIYRTHAVKAPQKAHAAQALETPAARDRE